MTIAYTPRLPRRMVAPWIVQIESGCDVPWRRVSLVAPRASDKGREASAWQRTKLHLFEDRSCQEAGQTPDTDRIQLIQAHNLLLDIVSSSVQHIYLL